MFLFYRVDREEREREELETKAANLEKSLLYKAELAANPDLIIQGEKIG